MISHAALPSPAWMRAMAPLGFMVGWFWWAWPTLDALSHHQNPVTVILRFGTAAVPDGRVEKCVWFGVGLLLVGLSYPTLWRSMGQWPPALRWVYYGSYALLAAGSLPLLSHDMLSYIGTAQVAAVYHRNPLTTPVVDVTHWRRDFWLVHAGWLAKRCPYGPLWVAWVSLSGHLAAPFWQQFVWIKGQALGMVWATSRCLGRLSVPTTARRFWLHPVVGLELLANGHNDAVMIGLMVLGYAAYQRRRYWTFAVLWTLACAIKFIPLVLVPLLLVGLSSVEQSLILAIGASVLGLLYLPYWQGWSTLLIPWSNQSMFLRSFDFMVQGLMVHVGHGHRTLSRHLATVTGLLGLSALGLERRHRWKTITRDPAVLADVLIGVALIGLSWFQYWYLVWALPFYLLSPSTRAQRITRWLVWAEAARVLGWLNHPPFAERQILQWAVMWLGFAWAIFQGRPRSIDIKEG